MGPNNLFGPTERPWVMEVAMKLGWVIGTVVLAATAAHADAPGWSRGQQELAITWDECVKRANGALQAESYRIDQAQPFMVGIKGQHTALIMCNPSPNQKTWVNIVVASNGEGGGVERQRLQARMDGQAPAQPPGPPQPPAPPSGGTGREGCQGANWSLTLEKGTVKPNDKINVRFASKGRFNDGDWISFHKLGDPPTQYYWYWTYATYIAASCTWTFSHYEQGQFAISYISSADGQEKARTVVTISDVASAQNRVEPPATPPAPPPAPKAVQYMGCFKDSNNPFDLDGYLERSRQNSPKRCIDLCAAKGFAYAGVQYGESCVCGNRYGTQGQANNCNMACTGDAKTVCGGANANSVYSTGR